MDDLVNALSAIQRQIAGSGIDLRLANGALRIQTQVGTKSFRLIHLYRPSSNDIRQSAASDAVLVLNLPSQKAALEARGVNHIVLPPGGYRLVSDGIALIRDAMADPTTKLKPAKLSGRTGVIAETLLLFDEPGWTVRHLAALAHVSQGLAHRLMMRLENEGILTSAGAGPEKRRYLKNARALIELWSDEETQQKRKVRGFLYGSEPRMIAEAILKECSGAAIGGTFAANLYKAVLTRVHYPIQIWLPEKYPVSELMRIGFEETEEGANVELLQAKEDPWAIHVERNGLARISKYRAWVEIAKAVGRTQELADALLADLKEPKQ